MINDAAYDAWFKKNLRCKQGIMSHFTLVLVLGVYSSLGSEAIRLFVIFTKAK
jgi:hypothetical protein